MKEQERKEKIATVLSLMNELMVHTGSNAAPDYHGVNNLDEVILYLKLHIEQLPTKRIGNIYVVYKSGEKLVDEKKPRTLEQMLTHGIECELSDAVRSKDMQEINAIHKRVSDALDICEDYREDLMEKLYEHRAKILSKVLDFVKGLRSIKSEGVEVKIETSDPWDYERIRVLEDILQREFPDIELGLIMNDINVCNYDDSSFMWNWVG